MITFVALLAHPGGAEAKPAAATKAWLRQIGAGKILPEQLIDPATGFVVLQYTTPGDSDDPPTKKSSRVCGEDAVGALAHVRASIMEAARYDEVFRCQNKPTISCTFGVAGEWEDEHTITFRRTAANTLVIAEILRTDGPYKPKDHARVLKKLRAQQADTTCRGMPEEGDDAIR